MVNTFQLNKEFSEWSEHTIYNYFKKNRRKLDLDIFFFGSQVSTVKKDDSDAPLRPDFILIKLNKLKKLQRKYNTNFNKPSNYFLRENIRSDYLKEVNKNKVYWMTKVLDKNFLMKDIIKNSHCMLEVKSGFGFFTKENYKKGYSNIMVMEKFVKNTKKLQRKFKRKVPIYITYVTFNKAFICSFKKMLEKGKFIKRFYPGGGISGAVGKNTLNLNFLNSYFFADISGVLINRGNGNYKVDARPIINIHEGKINFNLKMRRLGRLKNVNVSVIKKLKY